MSSREAFKRAAWILALIIVGLTFVGWLLIILNAGTQAPERWGSRGLHSTTALLYAIAGMLITSTRPRHPVGWVLLIVGLISALMGFGEEYAVYALLTEPGSLPGAPWIAAMASWIWLISQFLVLQLALRFPSGHPNRPAFRVFSWIATVWYVLLTVRLLLEPGPLINHGFIDNPFALPEPYTDLPRLAGPLITWALITNVIFAGSFLGLFDRIRTSGSFARRQLKWMALGYFSLPLGAFVGFIELPWLVPLNYVLAAGMPICISIAVVRHQLFDIDLLINRSLVYGSLSAFLLGLYGLTVFSAGALTQSDASLAGLVLTAVLGILLFHSTRYRIQRVVNRLLLTPSAAGVGLSLGSAGVSGPAERLAPESQPLAASEGYRAWLHRPAQALWLFIAGLVLIVTIASLPGYAAKIGGQAGHFFLENSSTLGRLLTALSALASFSSALLSYGLAGLLFRRRFRDAGLATVSIFLLLFGAILAGPLEIASQYWFGDTLLLEGLQGGLLSTPLIALLVLFPNGRFVPAWSKWVLVVSVPWGFGYLLYGPELLKLGFESPALIIGALSYLACFVAGLGAQIYRYQRVSGSSERSQTRWVIYGMVLWFLYLTVTSIPYLGLINLPPGSTLPWWAGISELIWWLSTAILPSVLAISVYKHQLWNIDAVINRTIVDGILTALLVLLYGLVVGLLGLAFQFSGNLALSLFATGLAAIIINPLRLRLQSGINRMMYGDRDDPVAVLQQMGDRLETARHPEEAMEGIVETVAQALKLPYVSIQLNDEPKTAYVYGGEPDHVERFSINYQGASTGWLQVSAR